MQQGLRPAFRRALIGREHASAEALCTAAEAVELELAATPDPNPTTREDIKKLISAMEASHVHHHDQSDAVASIQAVHGSRDMSTTRRHYGPVNNRPRGTWQQRPFQTRQREVKCSYCRYRGHQQEECRQRQADLARAPPKEFTVTRGGGTGRGRGIQADYRQQNNRRSSNTFGRVSAIETLAQWPTEEPDDDQCSDADSTERKSSPIRTGSKSNKSTLAWMFAIMCFLFVSSASETQLPETRWSTNVMPVTGSANSAPSTK